MIAGGSEGIADVSILCIELLHRDGQIHMMCSANQQMQPYFAGLCSDQEVCSHGIIARFQQA